LWEGGPPLCVWIIKGGRIRAGLNLGQFDAPVFGLALVGGVVGDGLGCHQIPGLRDDPRRLRD